MVKLGALAWVLLVTACASRPVTAELADDRLVLPGERLNKGEYVRHYLLTTITSGEDLPFSTSHSFMLPAPRKVWVGIFARTPSIWTIAPAGIQVVERKPDFPEFIHGGCDAVNVVADAYTGETLGSWCNVDDRQSFEGAVDRIPIFIPDGSPLRETS